MTELSNRPVALAFCLLVMTSLQDSVLADELTARAPVEYTAVYQVLRNGDRVAGLTLELSRHGDEWTYQGFTHDMRGLGKVLNVKGKQQVSGTWGDGNFQPRNFTFYFSLVGYRSRWQADFDWSIGAVTSGKKSKRATLPLSGSAMDPMSLMLNTGAMLSTGITEIAIDVIDENEIENHVYRAHRDEFLDTALGCMETARVERIRKNSKRRSTAWYAEQLAYIPLRVRHLKKRGSTLEASIVSLRVGTEEVPVSAACPVETGVVAGG